MNDNNQPLTTVLDFMNKWPIDRLAQIQDPIMREIVVDLVNVLGQAEYEADHAEGQAIKARSQAFWRL